EARRRDGEVQPAGQARTRCAPLADHGSDDAAQGSRAAARRRWPVRGDQGAAPGLLHHRLQGPRGGARLRQGIGCGESRRRLRNPSGRRVLSRECGVSEQEWIGGIIAAARPQAMAALVRNFRDLDAAEEAFQEACLRALKRGPRNGPPGDPAAWLIMVAKNAGIDSVRKQSRLEPLPAEEVISDRSDVEAAEADRIDEADYRDDILRLLFVCCHPDLPATQQIALALRIVSGLSVKQIARAFLVSEAAMEQRITRAKARIAGGQVPFETPGPIERAERLAAVAAMIYLLFNEGYTTNVAEQGAKAALCEEAIRLARLLLRLFPTEPEIMGLTA